MSQVDLIFDVGMNNGDDTVFYLALGYRVVAIEADPTLVQQVTERCHKEIAEGRLQILGVGVAETEGVLPFWVCEGKTEWSSFDKASASRNGRTCHRVDIPCVRFESILREHGVPHYLKIDIEMSDQDCLRGIDPSAPPEYMSLELTDESTFVLLRDLGYDSFKIIVQNDHRAVPQEPAGPVRSMRRRLPLYWRSLRSRLGLPVWASSYRPRGGGARHFATRGWKFPYGSSGAFGEQADGEWLTFEEATTLFDRFRRGDTELGPPGHLMWQDVHARITGVASVDP